VNGFIWRGMRTGLAKDGVVPSAFAGGIHCARGCA
jgi:hypothetical protein